MADRFLDASVAWLLRRYLPGFSLRPPIRPRKMKVFVPALPAMVNEPLTLTQRVQRFLLRFDRLGLTHLRRTLRPLALRSTVNLTTLGSVSENEILVPTGTLRLRLALMDAPDLAALKVPREKRSAPSPGLVLSGTASTTVTGVATQDPSGTSRPILPAAYSVNHSAPSEPAVMP